jgi:hypothetical protein
MAKSTAVSKPFVRIDWLDAEDYCESSWASTEELDSFTTRDCPVTSYGWLVSKTRTHVTIAADFTPPGTWGRTIKIPRKMITSQIILELAPPPVVQSP